MIEYSWFVLLLGFQHAFDIDHLVAMNNITIDKKNTKHVLRDGLLWGIGHTLIIILFGIFIILFKIYFSEEFFSFFEIIVGLLLIALGASKLLNLRKKNIHPAPTVDYFFLPFGTGIIHGMAGSGSIILGILTFQSISVLTSFLYLFIFGFASTASMCLIVYLLQYFQTIKISSFKHLKTALLIISSALCITIGTYIVWQNI